MFNLSNIVKYFIIWYFKWFANWDAELWKINKIESKGIIKETKVAAHKINLVVKI